MRKNIIKRLRTLIEDSKIKSFRFLKDGETKIVNFQNIKQFSDEELITNGTYISKSYVELFRDKFELKDIFENLIESPKRFIVESTDRILNFESTNHAYIQFIKRFIVAIKTNYEGEVISVGLKKLYDDNLEKLLEVYFHYKRNNAWSEIHNDKFITSVIIELLSDAKLFNYANAGRKRDKRHFKRRNLEHGKNSIKMYSHPFLFIINENNYLLTVEAYSSCMDMRYINSITSLNSRFERWLYKHYEKEFIDEIKQKENG